MDPFAANIAFVLLECQEAPINRVMALLQERPIKMPKCDDVACDWQVFKDTYQVRTNEMPPLLKASFDTCCVSYGTFARKAYKNA